MGKKEDCSLRAWSGWTCHSLCRRAPIMSWWTFPNLAARMICGFANGLHGRLGLRLCRDRPFFVKTSGIWSGSISQRKMKRWKRPWTVLNRSGINYNDWRMPSESIRIHFPNTRNHPIATCERTTVRISRPGDRAAYGSYALALHPCPANALPFPFLYFKLELL